MSISPGRTKSFCPPNQLTKHKEKSLENLKIDARTIEQTGENIIVQVIRLGEDECMTVADAAELLDVSPAGVRSMIRDHGMSVRRPHEHQLKEMRQAGVIPLKSPTANLLPKQTIQALVKIVNTDAAWAAYNQLWTIAEKGRSEDLSTIEALQKRLQDLEQNTCLNMDEMAEVIGAIKARYMELGIKCTDTSGYGTYAIPGTIRFIFGSIKLNFFDREDRKKYTWKNLPSRDLPKVLSFIAQWEPTETMWKNLRKYRHTLVLSSSCQ